MQEKRAVVRHTPSAEHPIEVQIMGANFFDVVRLQGRDISTGGLSLKADHRLHNGCAINQKVDLIITLPNDVPFKARAVIRHRQHANDSFGGYFGLHFTDITEHDRREIDRFIQRALLTKTGEPPS